MQSYARSIFEVKASVIFLDEDEEVSYYVVKKAKISGTDTMLVKVNLTYCKRVSRFCKTKPNNHS